MDSIIYLICLIPFLLVAIFFGSIYFFSTEMPSLRILYRTLGRDATAIYFFLKILAFIKMRHLADETLIDRFRCTVQKRRHKTCFIFEDEKWTYQKVDEFSNQVANYFASRGYSKGDEVALLLDNCIEFACIWLGLAKIGVVTALINTNLKRDSLGHSVNCIDTKGLIFGRNYSETVKDATPFFTKKDTMDFYCFTARGASNEEVVPFPAKSLNTSLEEASTSPIDPEKYKLTFHDKLIYIYTSGTTGLPKAAIIRHSRFLWISAATKYICGIGDNEIVYNSLPMYHTAGGLLVLSVMFTFGGTMILRKKFSASNFWKEAAKHNATVAQYIGETCRYLLNQPVIAEEKQHRIRLMLGNGVRSHIWKEFQERFGIERIVEIYGATEGNASIVNMFGKQGAVGFLVKIFDRLYPVFLVKVDPETREIMRNEQGLCIRCKPGEQGEMIGKIVSNPINSFDGYANQDETKKKIIRNCFKKGDMAFRSGDILVKDEEGYLYFIDRAGDTFRWRGENVSTSEVENIVSKALGYSACVVYGVEIPNVEGRAGMAAVQADPNSVKFTEFYQEISKRLPSYALPLFLRVSEKLEETGTYKLKKVTYQKEGYNPENVSDPLFFLDAKMKTYVPLTNELYSNIVSGKLRF